MRSELRMRERGGGVLSFYCFLHFRLPFIFLF